VSLTVHSLSVIRERETFPSEHFVVQSFLDTRSDQKITVNIKKSFIARQRKRRRDPMTILKKIHFWFQFPPAHQHSQSRFGGQFLIHEHSAAARLMLADRLKWRKN
jgi:hypothetical protein